MVAIDTNLLVRLLTRDNESEYRASHALFASEQIFIADTVILETEWVLRHAYELTPAEIRDALRRVLGLKNVTLANAQILARVLSWHEAGLDFADAFHLALSQGCDALKTFDKNFARKAKKLSSCPVEHP